MGNKIEDQGKFYSFPIYTIVISSTKDLWVLIININLISLILKFEMLVKLSTLSLFDKMVGWYSKLIIPIRHHEQGYKGKYNRRFNVDLFIDIYIFSLIFFFF